MKRLQHFFLDPVSKRPFVFLLLMLLFTVPGWLYCYTIYSEYYPLPRLVGWLLFITDDKIKDSQVCRLWWSYYSFCSQYLPDIKLQYND